MLLLANGERRAIFVWSVFSKSEPVWSKVVPKFSIFAQNCQFFAFLCHEIPKVRQMPKICYIKMPKIVINRDRLLQKRPKCKNYMTFFVSPKSQNVSLVSPNPKTVPQVRLLFLWLFFIGDIKYGIRQQDTTHFRTHRWGHMQPIP